MSGPTGPTGPVSLIYRDFLARCVPEATSFRQRDMIRGAFYAGAQVVLHCLGGPEDDPAETAILRAAIDRDLADYRAEMQSDLASGFRRPRPPRPSREGSG